jgi:hypothetical protein
MRLTREELRIVRQRLSGWQRPADMRLAVEQQMDKIGNKDLFKPGLVFVLEAWAAAVFAAERGASSARLIADERPDCELMLECGAVEAFEIVEADVLGRKRVSGEPYPAKRDIQMLKNGLRRSKRGRYSNTAH